MSERIGVFDVSFDGNTATMQYRKQASVEVYEDEDHEIIVEVLQSKRGTGAARAIVKTTAEWEAMADYIPAKGAILCYSDFTTDEAGKAVPGIKIGDGSTVIGELPFAAAGFAANVLTLTEEEALDILGGEPEPQPTPDPDNILTEEEVLAILNGEIDEPDSGEGGGADSNIMTEEEAIQILLSDE